MAQHASGSLSKWEPCDGSAIVVTNALMLIRFGDAVLQPRDATAGAVFPICSSFEAASRLARDPTAEIVFRCANAGLGPYIPKVTQIGRTWPLRTKLHPGVIQIGRTWSLQSKATPKVVQIGRTWPLHSKVIPRVIQMGRTCPLQFQIASKGGTQRPCHNDL
jgi:hypothetical protein